MGNNCTMAFIVMIELSLICILCGNNLDPTHASLLNACRPKGNERNSCPEGCRESDNGGCYNCTRMASNDNNNSVCCNHYFAIDTGCKTYCKPENSSKGHYDCDPETGNKICMEDYYNVDKNCAQHCKSTTFYYCDQLYGISTCYDPGCGYICVPPPGAGWFCNRQGNMQCHDHYYGPKCDVKCPPIPCPECHCHFRCDENGTATCEPGWFGPECNCTTDPTGHYRCDPNNGHIVCETGWEGDLCDCNFVKIHEAYHCDNVTGDKVCNENYYGESCVFCPPPIYRSDYYTCDNTTGAKLCFDGFYGENCTTYCRNIDNAQNYNCSDTGQKICAKDYYGTNCDIYCTPTAKYSCDPTTGQEVCSRGYAGKKCDVKVYYSHKYLAAFIVITVICVGLVLVIVALVLTNNKFRKQLNQVSTQKPRVFVAGRPTKHTKLVSRASFARRDSNVILSPPITPTRMRDPHDTLPPPPQQEISPTTSPDVATTSFGDSDLWKYISRHYDRPPHHFLQPRGTNDTFVPGLDDVGFDRRSVDTTDSFHLRLAPTQSAPPSENVYSDNSQKSIPPEMSRQNTQDASADVPSSTPVEEDPVYEEIKYRQSLLANSSSDNVLFRNPPKEEDAPGLSMSPNGGNDSCNELDPTAKSFASLTSLDIAEVLDIISVDNRLSNLSGVSGLSTYQWDGPPSKASTMPRPRREEDNWPGMDE